MSWRNGPWRSVARLTHLSAAGQRRMWRGVILVWGLALLAAWAVLSAFTRVAEKACEEAGQAYVAAAPLAAEVMDLRDRQGQMHGQPPLLAAERVARAAGIGPDRLRVLPAPASGSVADPGKIVRLQAQGLSLRELVEVLRNLQVQAGLGALSAHLAPTPGNDNRMDLDMLLSR